MDMTTNFNQNNSQYGTELQMNRDSEGGNFTEGMDAFSDKAIRNNFIKKVYTILTAQLLWTCGIICTFVFIEPVKRFMQEHRYIMYIAMGVYLVLVIVLACCEGPRRKFPLNMVILFILTTALSVMLGSVAASTSKEAVLIAAGSTAAITLALTFFAFQTKYDFTGFGPYLFVATICLMLFGLFCGIFRNNYANIAYGALGALLFSIYLVYDTQLIIGGKHKYSISPEEYIMAALNLYIDIAYIFMSILNLAGSSD
ncbi:hypothetical protein SNEBB_006542 [Seison nebaliae]|nr:hypothetical protein SNEBB_006542 [Seison nebaliae]